MARRQAQVASTLPAAALLFPFLLLTLLLSTPLAAGAFSYQEGIHLVRPDSPYITDDYAVPEYLTAEDLTFISCLEEDYPLRNSLLCLDDNNFEDLPSYPWSEQDNCYISSYNLEDFACERLVLQAEYTKQDESYKLTSVIKVNKLSKVLDRILDTQYSDGGWKDPLSTAYGIWAVSNFEDIYDYELDLALDWLKLNRNEEKKCWPKSPCNVEMSSHILALLTLSNYTDARRVVNDARNWFEELQNDFDPGDEWTASVQAVNDDTTLTIVSYNATLLDEDFLLPTDGSEKNYTFEAYMGARLIVISDDNVIVDLFNQDGKHLITYRGDNLSYRIPGPCWSLNLEGEPCDITTSLFAITADIDEDQKALAREWMIGELQKGEVLGSYLGDGDEDVKDTALYLYNLDNSTVETDGDPQLQEVVDWMLYTQNNEGSWGTNETMNKSEPTAFAALALLSAGFNRTSEPVQDAEEWASDHEDDIPPNNTRALGATFSILNHHARPLLAANPRIVLVDEPSLTIELINPTTFDLDALAYEFTDGLGDAIAIEEKEDIGAYSYRRVTITRKPTAAKEGFGFLIVTNLGTEVARIPFILTDTPTLNVSAPQTVTIFGKNGEIPFTATKSAHTFVCSMSWTSPEISTSGSVKIKAEKFNLPVDFTKVQTKEESYRGTLTCAAADKTVAVPIAVFLNRFSAPPLTITPEDAIINTTSTEVTFVLTNNLDRDITVNIAMDRYGTYFGFPPSVTLSPNEAYNLTLANKLPIDLNLTSSALLQLTVLGRTESVSLLIDVLAQPIVVKNPLAVLLPFVFIVVVLAVVAYLAWRFRAVLLAELNKLNFWRIKEEKRQESKRIKTMKKSEQNQAIVNLYNIMKFQKKDDKEIAGRLLANFPRQTIKNALEQAGVSLPILDEEEPKKL